MYTNLIIFLVAIFLFSATGMPETPELPGWASAMVLLAAFGSYYLLARSQFRRPTSSSGNYLGIEKRLSITALFFYGAALYLSDLKYYFAPLSLGGALPVLSNIAGIAVFLLFLVLIWLAGFRSYQRAFDAGGGLGRHVAVNIRTNLPIILPWIILSLFYDLVALLPFSALRQIMASGWGDVGFFAVFLIFVVIFFPPLVRRLWGCKRLPAGYLRSHLEGFAASQGFYADFYVWPLYEGRAVTAGVMGIVPGLRYILLTPALVETMNREELEAVLAHEIGHVKKRHLLLYVLLIGGFSLFAGLLAEPFIYLILSSGFINRGIIESGISPEYVLAAVGAVPLLLLMLLYFRFLFGYFIRNFERQADLFSLQVIGNSQALVSAFEKIALISGLSREERNWHHFGIGERIDCLQQAEREPKLIGRQDRKVKYSLLVYGLVLSLCLVTAYQLPTEELERSYHENFAEAVLTYKARQEPERALWQRMLGDLMLSRKLENRALENYRAAFALEPTNPEIMNNLAWLLLTSRDLSQRDPAQALVLARAASVLLEKGHILDTLATALWANGFVAEAIETERRAMALDVGQKRFYQAQIDRFMQMSYEESLKQGIPPPTAEPEVQ